MARPHLDVARKTSHEPSIPTQLAKAGWSKDDVDLFELNEAFAAQSVAVIRELKLDERKVLTVRCRSNAVLAGEFSRGREWVKFFVDRKNLTRLREKFVLEI